MLGVDDSPASLGVIPCAIDWLFRLINDQKERTGARFSVRVSAVEVTGKQEQLRDLLADTATGKLRCAVCLVPFTLRQTVVHLFFLFACLPLLWSQFK